jgi:hypothetical protein
VSAPGTGLMLGDVFGLGALALIGGTAVMMLLRRQILRRFKNLEVVRRVHLLVAGLAGLFLVLHVAFFVSYPVTLEILLGYVSGVIAVAVWVTGTAFLERFRDSLYFHGTLSLSAISLMVIHSAAAGLNVPFALAEVVLGGATAVAVLKATQYIQKLSAAGGGPRR